MAAESNPATEPLDDYSDSTLYRWVIRSLYVAAIGLNVWILWKASADEVEVAIFKAKARTAIAKALRPFTLERDWRRAVNRMHYAAADTVEHGAPVEMGDNPDA